MQNIRWIKYCRHCLMSETKPDLPIDAEGVCGACRGYEQCKEVEWGKCKKELLAITKRYRSRNDNNYDCIVPVSGGKDSHGVYAYFIR